MKKYFHLIRVLIMVVLMVFASITVISAFAPQAGWHLYSVDSGSMGPTIPTGSLILAVPSADYSVNDVVVFKPEADRQNPRPKMTTTHRIVRETVTAKGEVYETRGDANAASDAETIDADLVIGKVMWHLPFAGYIIAFSRTQAGFMGLVVLPATLIIFAEIESIYREIKMMEAARKTKTRAFFIRKIRYGRIR